ncbi:MAG: metallophosphoesterase [Actinomycetota bacterium]|nr:metallophosphoesterase [Actinomycetota bacterium]
MDLTTVADDLIVLHEGTTVARFEQLQPATRYTLMGHDITTMARPPGELLGRIATVNDVHFGEIECGRIDDHPEGPIQRPEPGEPPYPETMNRAAVTEIAAIDPMAIVVKGDLSQDGRPDEWAAFEACYRPAFGERLHVVRGNHDAYHGQTGYAGDRWIDLPGVSIALLDTVIPMATTGSVSAEQLDWLDAHAAGADRPVLVMGHHQQWIAGGADARRSDDYFGLHPDASDALAEVVARRHRIVAYTAGHTHRHRVRHMSCGVPTIEIGCVKDFPGTWAEYRIYEGGVTQVVHRVSSPEALRWSERCRHLYRDFGIDYESYALGALEDRCCNIPLR